MQSLRALKYFLAVISFFILSVFLTINPIQAQTCGITSGTQTVTQIATTVFRGPATAIARSSDSLPIVSFYQGSVGNQSQSIKCGNAACSSGNTTVVLGGVGRYGTGFAVPSDGLPVIAYNLDGTPPSLKLAKCANISCSSRTEYHGDSGTIPAGAEVPYTGWFNAIAVGADNRPIVAYTQDTNWGASAGTWYTDALKVLKCGNSSCSSGNTINSFYTSPSNAPSGGQTSIFGISIDVPADNIPIISWYMYNGSSVQFMMTRCNNAACSGGSTVRNLGSVNPYSVGTGIMFWWGWVVPTSAIKLGSNGFPIIAYYDAGIKVMACGNATCSTGNVITTINTSTGQYANKVAMTIPADGRPLIALTTGTGLVIARCANATCTSISSTNIIGGTNANIAEKSIVMGADGFPMVAFRDTTGYTGSGQNGPAGNVKVLRCPDIGCSPSVPSTCTSSAPVAPGGVTVSEGDGNGGAIIQTRSAKIDWAFTDTGSGCGTSWGYNCGAQNNQFIIRITGPAGFTPFTTTVGPAVRTYTTGTILTQNGVYTVNVCANNGVLETCGSTNFTKVAYATGTLTGSLQERTPNSTPTAVCNINGVRASYVNTITLTGGAGVTTDCGITPAAGIATSYGCTVTLNNTSADPNPNASYTLQLGSASAMYGSIACGGASCAAAGSCTNTFTPDLDANGGTSVSSTQTLYMNLQNTISGGPSAFYGYYRVKNLSYYDRDSITSVFPVGHQPYDTDDTPTVDHFSRGDDGTNFVGVGPVMSNGTQQVGAFGASNSGVSPKGWSNSAYLHNNISTIGTKYIDYVKNRRVYKTITALSTDTTFTGNNNAIFLVANGNLTVSPADVASLSNKNAIIVVNGDLNINANLTSATSNLAFIAQNIYISETVSEVRALIMGNVVSLVSQGFASISTTPLKIVGSLASGATVDVTRRTRSDSFKPSFFIVANPDTYINLLSNISTVRYDWKQTQ